jgi:3-dehydroquinate dehydratase
VAIIDHGQLQRVVTVRDAAGVGTERRWRIRAVVAAEAVAARFHGAIVSGHDIECTADVAALNRGLAAAIAEGALVVAVAPAESSLEEAFRTSVTSR